MMWLYYLYPIPGLFTARWVWIRRGRKQEGYECNSWECKNGYSTCSRCYSRPWRAIPTLVAGLFWPVAAADGLLYGVWWVVARITEGIGKVGKIVLGTSPVRTLARVNKWFWQDPRDRKKVIEPEPEPIPRPLDDPPHLSRADLAILRARAVSVSRVRK